MKLINPIIRRKVEPIKKQTESYSRPANEAFGIFSNHLWVPLHAAQAVSISYANEKRLIDGWYEPKKS